MLAEIDELSRLRSRIAELEARIADEQCNQTNLPFSLTGRVQLLQMLVRTLEAMRARAAKVASLKEIAS